jgi:hypothetical protein
MKTDEKPIPGTYQEGDLHEPLGKIIKYLAGYSPGLIVFLCMDGYLEWECRLVDDKGKSVYPFNATVFSTARSAISKLRAKEPIDSYFEKAGAIAELLFASAITPSNPGFIVDRIQDISHL